jgi:nicotinate-nucleotide adenylyltransferase
VWRKNLTLHSESAVSHKKIGIMGGSFDPPHFGHLRAGFEAYETAGLEQVYFVPVGTPPHAKNTPCARGADRVAMLRCALEGTSWAGVSDWELHQDGLSYTIHTLNYFAACYPDARLYLIIGADAATGFERWYQWRDILDTAELLVADRPHDAPLTKYGQTLGNTQLDISSSTIRQLLAQGRSPRYLLPDVVIDYIHEHKLYQKG